MAMFEQPKDDRQSEIEEKVAELKAENSKLKKVLTRVENAVSVVMSCNWKDCACRHGTEYGDDVEFDYLCSVISKCQDQMKEEDNVMDKVRVVAGVRYCEDASAESSWKTILKRNDYAREY